MFQSLKVYKKRKIEILSNIETLKHFILLI